MNPFQSLAKKKIKGRIDKSLCPNYKSCKTWVFWVTLLLGMLVAAGSYYILMAHFTKSCRVSG